MSEQSKPSYQFGPFYLDTAERQLLRDGAPVVLTPKVYDILLALLEHSGHVLEKDELIERVWPDTIVEENNLTVNMSALRKALGEHQFIETVPRRGYRFVGPVRQVWDEEVDLVVEKHSTSSLTIEEEEGRPATERLAAARRGWLAAIASASRVRGWRASWPVLMVTTLVALVVAGFYGWRRSPRLETPAAVKTIAVLPFKPLRSDGSDEYLGLGMADTLITKLGGLRSLVVRPTSAVRKYAGLDQDPLQAGREQKVEAVLDASLQHAGEHLRVTVRLLRVADEKTLWTYQCDEEYCANIFAMQDAISERVAAALVTELSGAERLRLRKRYTENREAWQLYLQGRYYWNKRSEEGYQKAIAYFEQAIAKDPNYALAYAGLADCDIMLEARPRAKQMALKALELDSELVEAHTSLAFLKLIHDWDFQGAAQSFRHALELNPNYPTAHHWYAYNLLILGQVEEALAEIKRAQELDPVSLIINTDVSEFLYHAHRFDEAVAQARKTLELDLNFAPAHLVLGLAYEQQSAVEAAIAELRQAVHLDGYFGRVAQLGSMYARAGRRAEAQTILRESLEQAKREPKFAYLIAEIYAGLGERDQAFAWLEKAYQGRDFLMPFLKVNPRVDSLRADPRFADLLRRVGLAAVSS